MALILLSILIYVVLPSLLFVISSLKFWVLCLVTLGFEVLGFVLLGLPGAAFLELLQPMMVKLGKPLIPADGAWGGAIVLSFLTLGFLLAGWAAKVFFTSHPFWGKVSLVSIPFYL
jgi:hypothetical protein